MKKLAIKSRVELAPQLNIKLETEKMSALRKANCTRSVAVHGMLRSGSTFLLRLINQACCMTMVGETVTTIRGLVDLFDTIKEKPELPVMLDTLTERDELPFNYDNHDRRMRYINLLTYMQHRLGNYISLNYKMTDFGWPGFYQASKRWLEILQFYRDFDHEFIYNHHKTPQVVWLTRPIHEIIDSMDKSPHLLKVFDCHNQREQFIFQLPKVLDEQEQFFHAHRSDDDLILSYSELVKDPKAVLIELGLKCDDMKLQEIRSLKIR